MKSFVLFSVVLSAAGALARSPAPHRGEYSGMNNRHNGGSHSGGKVMLPSLDEFEAGYKLYKSQVTTSRLPVTPMQVWYGYLDKIIHGGGQWQNSETMTYPESTTSSDEPAPIMSTSDEPMSTISNSDEPMPTMTTSDEPMPTTTDMPPGQAGPGKVIDVIVGKDDQLTYTPDDIIAKVGDIVRFHFVSKNHTVTQSERNDPCNLTEGGFDSGFQPIEAGSGNVKTFDFQVTQDKKPIWFYCKQFVPAKGLSHCQLGMVGAVNADRDGQNSLNAFRTRASSSD